MGRVILNTQVKSGNSKLSIESNNINNTTAKTNISLIDSETLLRKKRSKQYMEAIAKLDSGNICLDGSLKDELINAIKKEFGQIEIEDLKQIEADLFPKGIIAKCYLGDDYEVHTLSMTLRIVKHYKTNDVLPIELEKARNIANNKNYAFVEVYSDMLRAISIDGSVSEIKIQ